MTAIPLLRDVRRSLPGGEKNASAGLQFESIRLRLF
jgi:hypothetical protein